MALYEYVCVDGHSTDKDFPLTQEKPQEVTCLMEIDSGRICAKPARRKFGFAGFKI